MEEFDCHSSNGNSPSGYQLHDIPPLSLFDYEKCAFKSAKQPKENSANSPMSQYIENAYQQYLRQNEADFKRTTPSMQKQQQQHPRETSTSSKDIRRQTGQWFNMNLEKELGYIP